MILLEVLVLLNVRMQTVLFVEQFECVCLQIQHSHFRAMWFFFSVMEVIAPKSEGASTPMAWCLYWLLRNSVLKYSYRIFVDLRHTKKAYKDLDRKVLEILQQASNMLEQLQSKNVLTIFLIRQISYPIKSLEATDYTREKAHDFVKVIPPTN